MMFVKIHDITMFNVANAHMLYHVILNFKGYIIEHPALVPEVLLQKCS